MRVKNKPMAFPGPRSRAYTLVEILVTLAIVAIIGVFIIPPIVNAGGQGTANDYKRRTQQAAMIIQSAYDRYRSDHILTAAATDLDFTPYMNYTQADTTGSIDDKQGDPAISLTCNSWSGYCLRLPNGATIFACNDSFGTTNNTSAVRFIVDPDSKVTDGTSNGPGKSIIFHLYYSGKLVTRGTIPSGTVACDQGGSGGPCFAPDASADPPWFNWN